MKKTHVFIVIAVCFGLLLTWGALRASATQNQPPAKGSAHNDASVTESLIVYVETADGHPAANALVMAGTLSGLASDSGYTGPDGYVTLDLPAGNYAVIATSMDDHFYLYKYPVSFPGSITMSAVGTPEVTLIAKKKDGSPLDQAFVAINITGGYANMWMYGRLGYVDASGEMVFHVTPNIYDVIVADTVNDYLLYKADQNISVPSNVLDFDMSIQPSAELAVGHTNDDHSDLTVCTYEHNLLCPSYIDMLDGERLVVSTGLGYLPIQDILREDTLGNQWEYSFYMSNYNDYFYFSSNEVITFSVGGDLSVLGRTEDAHGGDYISLAETVDSFGSILTNIYTNTADHSSSGWVYPEIQLTDPENNVVQLNSIWYRLPDNAPTGLYDVHFEWNTGLPYQGVISGDSQFMVLPQQTSAVITINGGELYSTWDDTLYEFPPGTFTDTVIVTHTVRYAEIPASTPLLGIGHFYDVTAVYSDTRLPAQPTQPYTITIGYTHREKGAAIESSLRLFKWEGLKWVLEPTSTVDPINNQLIATPDHFSTWGILGETNRVFLSLIHR
jgi:hypothetical protein